MEFTVNGQRIEQVQYFKYLGRYFSDDDDNTRCIMENIWSARQKWNSIVNILKREGANAACMSQFYMAVVQAVLLYGADLWCISEKNMQSLRSFHRRAIRYMTGDHIWKEGEDSWTVPDHKHLLKKCQLLPIEDDGGVDVPLSAASQDLQLVTEKSPLP